jgi:hypothetical protein
MTPVNEAEWLAATDPMSMLKFLRGKVSNRKLRLFAVACCRHIWPMLTDERSRKAVQTSERYADRQCCMADLQLAYAIACDAALLAETADGSRAVANSACGAVEDDPLIAAVGSAMGAAVARGARATAIHGATDKNSSDIWDETAFAEQGVQSGLLREILGNPFRPASAVDPACLAWQGGAVRELARAAYEERRLPEGTLEPAQVAALADALEDASCGDAELIGHLRGPGPHVRGCWAVDLLLGKE